jgi:hypothetical protein
MTQLISSSSSDPNAVVPFVAGQSNDSPGMWDSFVQFAKDNKWLSTAAAVAAFAGLAVGAHKMKTEAQERQKAARIAARQQGQNGAASAQSGLEWRGGKLQKKREKATVRNTLTDWGGWTLRNLLKVGTIAAGVTAYDRYTGTERSNLQLGLMAGFIAYCTERSKLGALVDKTVFGSLQDPTQMDPANRSVLDSILEYGKAVAVAAVASALGVASPIVTVPAAVAATFMGQTEEMQKAVVMSTTTIEWRGGRYEIDYNEEIMDPEIAQAMVLNLFENAKTQSGNIDLTKPLQIVPYEENGVGKYEFRDEANNKLCTVDDTCLTEPKSLLELQPGDSVYHTIFKGADTRTSPIRSKGTTALYFGGASATVAGCPTIKWSNNSCAFSAFVFTYILPNLAAIKASLEQRKDTDKIAAELLKFVVALEEAHNKRVEFTGIDELRRIGNMAGAKYGVASAEDDIEIRDLLLPHLFGQTSPYTLAPTVSNNPPMTHLNIDLTNAPRTGTGAVQYVEALGLIKAQDLYVNATQAPGTAVTYDITRMSQNGSGAFDETPLMGIPMSHDGRELQSIVCHVPGVDLNGKPVAHKFVLRRELSFGGIRQTWYKLDDKDGNKEMTNKDELDRLIRKHSTSLIYA